MQVSDFSALRYDSKCVRPQEAVRELDQSEQLSTKEVTLGRWESTRARLLLRGWGVCGVGGTFQGVFQVYKEHGPEAKQSSDSPETSAQKNPPSKADICCHTKKVPTPSKPCWGQSMWACGMCYAQRHR